MLRIVLMTLSRSTVSNVRASGVFNLEQTLRSCGQPGDILDEVLLSKDVQKARVLSEKTLRREPQLCALQELLVFGWDAALTMEAYDLMEDAKEFGQAQSGEYQDVPAARCGKCCEIWRKPVCNYIYAHLEKGYYTRFQIAASKAAGFDLTYTCGRSFMRHTVDTLVAGYGQEVGWQTMETLRPLGPGEELGQRAGLSPTDILMVNMVYSCPQQFSPIKTQGRPTMRVEVFHTEVGGKVTTASVLAVTYSLPRFTASSVDQIQVKDIAGRTWRSEILTQISGADVSPTVSGTTVLYLNPVGSPDWVSPRGMPEVLPPGRYTVELYTPKSSEHAEPVVLDVQVPSRSSPPGYPMLDFTGNYVSALSWRMPLIRTWRTRYNVLRAKIREHRCQDLLSGSQQQWMAASGPLRGYRCDVFWGREAWCYNGPHLSQEGVSNTEACCACRGGTSLLRRNDLGAGVVEVDPFLAVVGNVFDGKLTDEQLRRATEGCTWVNGWSRTFYDCAFKIEAITSESTASRATVTGPPTVLITQLRDGSISYVENIIGQAKPRDSELVAPFEKPEIDSCPAELCPSDGSKCMTGPCTNCKFCDGCPGGPLTFTSDGMGSLTLPNMPTGKENDKLALRCPGAGGQGIVDLVCEDRLWTVEWENCQPLMCEQQNVRWNWDYFALPKRPVGMYGVECPRGYQGTIVCKCEDFGSWSGRWTCDDNNNQCRPVALGI